MKAGFAKLIKMLDLDCTMVGHAGLKPFLPRLVSVILVRVIYWWCQALGSPRLQNLPLRADSTELNIVLIGMDKLDFIFLPLSWLYWTDSLLYPEGAKSHVGRWPCAFSFQTALLTISSQYEQLLRSLRGSRLWWVILFLPFSCPQNINLPPLALFCFWPGLQFHPPAPALSNI